ncbi:MAG: SIMPL domain-containing protein [Thaumarchaeota archaeon]|nr:SIMPL domain-containing protein [Nitrososphaerota archaeon]MBI3641728.1 SIMPL domain-containing protein [Nitrososphaerota archaeon]
MRKRQAILVSSVGTAALIGVLSILVIPGLSYSVEDTSQVFKNALLSSDGTTITVTGQSSQRIQSDQVTLDLLVPVIPSDVNSVTSKQKESVQNLADAITSSVGQDNVSILVGQTNLNPYYSNGNPLDSSLFTAYATVPIKTDFDHFSNISPILANAGFKMDSISVSQVPVSPASTVSSKTITITSGSGASANSDCVSANNCFSPNPISVKAGTLVTWNNSDSVSHTITSGKPSDTNTGSMFDSGLIKPGQSFQHTFQSADTYDYYCAVHPWMTGTVTVTANGNNSTLPETKSQITINIVVDTKPDTLQNSLKAYQERFATLQNILNEKGISIDQSKQNQLNFNQFYSNPTQYSYFTSNTDVIVKTDPKNIDKVLQVAKNQKASISNIVLSTSDSSIDAIRKDLTQKAIEDATKNAEDILDSTGLTIKGIKSIEINPPSMTSGQPVDYHGIRLASNDPAFYQAGQASVSVTIEFQVGK